MITKWTAANFKSIVNETAIDMAPLTILSGPNSSGKSTVLQSLLLVSQTLANKVGSRSVILNGTFTRLGQFDDIKTYGSEHDQVIVGWKCCPAKELQTDSYERTINGFLLRRMNTIKEISCKLSFDSNPSSPERDKFQLQPRVFLYSISVLASGEDMTDRRYELTISRSTSDIDKLESCEIDELSNENIRSSLEYDIELDAISKEELCEEFATAEAVGCTLKHFLPISLTVRVNIIEELAKQILIVLMEELPRYRRRTFMGRELIIPNNVIKFIQESLVEKYPSLFEKKLDLFQVESEIDTREWIDRLRKLPIEIRRNFHSEVSRIFPDKSVLYNLIVSALQQERKNGQPEFRLIQLPLPSGLRDAACYLEGIFTNSVKYLGPLRDEPKSLYPLATYADPTDVGIRGEMTAAVLNLHREQLIKYIPSSIFLKNPLTLFDPVGSGRSLEGAVDDWLKYLGVAESVYSVDKGKLGHEMKVSLAEDGPKRDLTHVGVGVSQVLPILVMSLLAAPDTMLVFEQPELHLHPKVQTRLADFFLSLALMGRQCLIETHSEYLINRLRYRAAAEGDGNRVTENLKIYFVENKIEGSEFREVKVNEFGAILDWPEGFFDQSQREAEEILRAAMNKKRARKNGVKTNA
jgi:predicted ATPase